MTSAAEVRANSRIDALGALCGAFYETDHHPRNNKDNDTCRLPYLLARYGIQTGIRWLLICVARNRWHYRQDISSSHFISRS